MFTTAIRKLRLNKAVSLELHASAMLRTGQAFLYIQKEKPQKPTHTLNSAPSEER